MKILVTGANGFLGRSILPDLLREGHSITTISRTNSDLSQLFPKINSLVGNYSDPVLLDKILPETDLVIHLAYSTVPEDSTLNPVFDIETNVIPSLTLFNYCSKHNVKNFYFVSSGGVVYGNKTDFPIKEIALANPVSSYGISKFMIESQFLLLEQKLGIQTTVFRIANAYGLGQHSRKNQGVINIWMDQIKRGEKIKIMGDGNIVRDYIHTDDISAAIILSIKNNVNGVFNLGTGVGTSLNQLVQILESVIGKKANIEYLPSRKFDVEKNILDFSLIRQKANWSPKVSLEEGINQIYLSKFGK